MSPSKSFQKSLPLLILVISLLAIYLKTLAPGLTWANDGSDGGDLISAAATGGVAHPTGYPLYLLLARLFQFLPVGTLAFRTNLLSAVAMVSASVLVYLLVRESSPNQQETNVWLAPLAAGYAFGLAPLVWSQAVITEVYGLQAFLLALILYLYTNPRLISTSSQKRLDGWRGFALGLAMGNHVTTLLLVPIALVIGSVNQQSQSEDSPDPGRAWFRHLKLDGGALLRQLGMFGVGLCPYLIVPFRALANPPVNWGNPITLQRFWWLVSGQIYHSYYLQFNQAELWGRIQAWAALLLEQWGVIGLVLAFIGLIYFFSLSRLSLFTLWQAVVYSGFAMFYGSVDSYVYLLPVCISFSVWIGFGLARMMNVEVLRSSRIGLVVISLFLLYLFGSAAYHWSLVDASQDAKAEAFGRQILESAPPNALVFAKGDEAVFSLWYFHFALRGRPDLTVVAEDLLHFDWYQEDLRATYPALVVPTPFPWATTLASSNPTRAICYVHYSTQTEINCSQPTKSP